MENPQRKIVVVRTTKRDVLIGIVVGVLILGFIGFGIYSLARNTGGGDLTGTITARTFTPQPEQQISIGRAGLQERKVDGSYTFEVSVGPEKRIYTVWVDKEVYASHKAGDRFTFPRPPPEPR